MNDLRELAELIKPKNELEKRISEMINRPRYDW